MFSVLNGGLFMVVGGLMSMLIIEDGWSMDPKSTSVATWLLGSPLIVTTVIGSYARGAGLIGFISLSCGTPLGSRWTRIFGLCGGSFVALLVWRLADSGGAITSGVVGLIALVAGWQLATWLAGTAVSFGRRARRRAARGFLLGLVLGASAAMIPLGNWLLFSWNPPMSLWLGAAIGSNLGITIGMLWGAESNNPLQGSPLEPPKHMAADPAAADPPAAATE